MDWYRADWDMSVHPKTKQLARRLGWDRMRAVGAIHALWGFAARYHQDGELVDADLVDLAEWVGLPMTASDVTQTVTLPILLDAMVSVGLVDGDNLEIHEWIDYQSKVWDTIEKAEVQREKTRERVKKHRAKKPKRNVTTPKPLPVQQPTEPTGNVTSSEGGNVTGSESVPLHVTPGNANTIRNDTLRNETLRNENPPISPTTDSPKQKPKKGKPDPSHSLYPVFQRLRILHPERFGPDPDPPAWSALLARVKEGVDPDDILRGSAEYRDYILQTGKMGTEFVSQLRYWLGPKSRGWEQRYQKPKTAPVGNVFDRLADRENPSKSVGIPEQETTPVEVPVGPDDEPPLGDPPDDMELE